MPMVPGRRAQLVHPGPVVALDAHRSRWSRVGRAVARRRAHASGSLDFTVSFATTDHGQLAGGATTATLLNSRDADRQRRWAR